MHEGAVEKRTTNKRYDHPLNEDISNPLEPIGQKLTPTREKQY